MFLLLLWDGVGWGGGVGMGWGGVGGVGWGVGAFYHGTQMIDYGE